MSSPYKRFAIADLSGGRNGIDAPTSPAFKDNECVDAVNVDYWRSSFGRKRRGMTAASVTFSAGGPFTGKISFLGRHVPGTDASAAELWAVDDAATPIVGRRTSSTAMTAPSLVDAITGNAWDVDGVSFNGKFFLAYKSAQARLHCYDPVSGTVRRTGLPVPGAPTAADNGTPGLAYAAVLR